MTKTLTSPGSHLGLDPHQTAQSQDADLSAHTPVPDEHKNKLKLIQTGTGGQ